MKKSINEWFSRWSVFGSIGFCITIYLGKFAFENVSDLLRGNLPSYQVYVISDVFFYITLGLALIILIMFGNLGVQLELFKTFKPKLRFGSVALFSGLTGFVLSEIVLRQIWNSINVILVNQVALDTINKLNRIFIYHYAVSLLITGVFSTIGLNIMMIRNITKKKAKVGAEMERAYYYDAPENALLDCTDENVVQYKKYLPDLSWHEPEEVQKQAIDALVSIPDEYINLLLQPLEKSHWGNAAIVIQKIGYPRYKQYIPELLEWLQDMNWPGALEITKSLATINFTEIKPYIEQATLLARQSRDSTWLYGLFILVDDADWLRPELWSDEVYLALTQQ